MSSRFSPEVETTWYFETVVRERRPYLRDAWLRDAIERPEFTEVQLDGRTRRWIFIDELGRYLRVVTLADGKTIQTAFPDRGFRPDKR